MEAVTVELTAGQADLLKRLLESGVFTDSLFGSPEFEEETAVIETVIQQLAIGVKKPDKKVMTYYDYDECRQYLEKKYGYDERDYAGRFTGRGNERAPYQDFWHFVVEKGSAHNDALMVMSEWWKEGAEPWQAEILERYLSEFGEGDPGDRSIEFWVSW